MLTENQRPRILGVAQVAQHVRDIEAARAFYRGFLGFDEMLSFANPDGSLRAALIKIDERQSVQLITAPASGNPLDHVGLETDDAEAMRLYLKSRGIDVPGEVKKGRFTACFFSVVDPDGNTVEFMQFTPDSFTLRDFGQHLPATRRGTHLSSFGMAMRDLEKARSFYRDVLGCIESHPARAERIQLTVPDGTDRIELHHGAGHQLALRAPTAALRLNPAVVDPDGTRIEFVDG